MNPVRPTLIALTLLATLSFAAQPAQAGTLANPEVVDDNDEVAISGPGGKVCSGGPAGGCPGFDFLWADTDINSAFVNETADALTFTLEMKAGKSFGAGSGAGGGVDDECTYAFTFVLGGATYTASADVAADGTPTAKGVATAAVVHDSNQMTLSVPKAAVKAFPGDVLSGLFVTAHCETDAGIILDDRAPDANTGRAYTLAGTAAGKVQYYSLTGATATVQQSFSRPTTETDIYNWTSPAANLTLSYNVKPVAGSVSIRIATVAGNPTLQEGTFTARDAGNLTLGDAKGALQVTLKYTGYNGTVVLGLSGQKAATGTPTSTSGTSTATKTATQGFTFQSTSRSTSGTGGTSSSTSKGSPSTGILALGAAIAVSLVLVRRRIA
ncbi:MAG TPA: hypothetical protein VM286_08370 [Candidatus Thermoplasmatota archaeon]|nr:hypothetical protein [Candidatus Thermoplasmatota archaeon]